MLTPVMRYMAWQTIGYTEAGQCCNALNEGQELHFSPAQPTKARTITMGLSQFYNSYTVRRNYYCLPDSDIGACSSNAKAGLGHGMKLHLGNSQLKECRVYGLHETKRQDDWEDYWGVFIGL
jgi:hypothetical protein